MRERREVAVALVLEGEDINEVAELVGVTPASVHKWCHAEQNATPVSLDSRTLTPGMPRSGKP
jgi:transposase